MCVSLITISKLYLHHHKVYLFILLLTCHTMTIISISILLLILFMFHNDCPSNTLLVNFSWLGIFLALVVVPTLLANTTWYTIFPLLSKLFSSPSQVKWNSFPKFHARNVHNRGTLTCMCSKRQVVRKVDKDLTPLWCLLKDWILGKSCGNLSLPLHMSSIF